MQLVGAQLVDDGTMAHAFGLSGIGEDIATFDSAMSDGRLFVGPVDVLVHRVHGLLDTSQVHGLRSDVFGVLMVARLQRLAARPCPMASMLIISLSLRFFKLIILAHLHLVALISNNELQRTTIF